MPWAAAALVTSGSFAAPSSIEYSVCTCRCTNESDVDGVVTGGRAPQGSCVPGRRDPAGDRRGRPAGLFGRGGALGSPPREGLPPGAGRNWLAPGGPHGHTPPPPRPPGAGARPAGGAP